MRNQTGKLVTRKPYFVVLTFLSRRSRRRSRTAFTLVELMVVIAIIAVLISILLPSLSAIRRQTKVAQTKTTISMLETGVQAFMTDSRCGGSLPPSAPPPIAVTSGPPIGQVYNPHLLTNTAVRIDGANFLFWALAGADMLGTPGFQDVDGNGNWSDNTGKSGLYAINADGTPASQRVGPFVEISKMKLPVMVNPSDPSQGFAIPAAKSGGRTTLPSLCFLDSFDQPILYYRTTPSNTGMAYNSLGTGCAAGIYNMADNIQITGLDTALGILPGMNFGKGRLTNNAFHHLATLGEICNTDPQDTLDWLRTTAAPERYSFGYTIWNPNVTAIPRPHNDKSYLLLSAGPDGVFGSPDDIGNFTINP